MSNPIFEQSFWKERLEQSHKDHLYGAVRHSLPEHLDLYIKCLKQDLPNFIHPSESVLDAGCGIGTLIEGLKDFHTGVYCGLDLSEDFIDICRNKYPRKTFIRGDLRKIPLEDKSYDVVVLADVVTMVEVNMPDSLPGIMKEVYRVGNRVLIAEIQQYFNPLYVQYGTIFPEDASYED